MDFCSPKEVSRPVESDRSTPCEQEARAQSEGESEGACAWNERTKLVFGEPCSNAPEEGKDPIALESSFGRRLALLCGDDADRFEAPQYAMHAHREFGRGPAFREWYHRRG